MRMDWEVRLPRKLMTSWVYHHRPNGGPVMHFGRNLKRDLLRIELSMDPPPAVFPDAVRVSDRQRNKSRSQVQRFGNIAPRSKAREIKRLLTPIVEPPPAQYWVRLTGNKRVREIFEDFNTLRCRVRVVLNLNKFQWFGDSIPNEFRGMFLQRESKHTEALIGRHPIGHLRTHMHTRY